MALSPDDTLTGTRSRADSTVSVASSGEYIEENMTENSDGDFRIETLPSEPSNFELATEQLSQKIKATVPESLKNLSQRLSSLISSTAVSSISSPRIEGTGSGDKERDKKAQDEDFSTGTRSRADSAVSIASSGEFIEENMIENSDGDFRIETLTSEPSNFELATEQLSQKIKATVPESLKNLSQRLSSLISSTAVSSISSPRIEGTELNSATSSPIIISRSSFPTSDEEEVPVLKRRLSAGSFTDKF